ncbi:MAG: metallophosphoesterase family protein [Candidatus Heimdallarchaeaceae archaeon]
MVKILHISDTHVSHRKFRNVKDSWKIHNRVTWIEEDYCLGFKQTLDIGFKQTLDIAADVKCDYLVHSGDFFDIPVGRNFSGPSEYSRTFAITALKKFFEKTEFKIPLLIIDGNHGTYLTRNYSTIEFLQAAFPNNIHIFTNYQLKNAIRNNTPLTLEFDDVKFFMFPYLKFGRLENWAQEYEKWLQNNQQPDPEKISIAVAHGMERGMDLHELQCGSSARYTFAERNQVKGVLEVDVEKGKDSIVKTIKIESVRSMKQIDYTLNTDLTTVGFEKEIRNKIAEFKNKFDGDKAVRLKIKFDGAVLLSNWWGMEDILNEIQKEVFTDNYNILEFRWDTGEVIKRAPISLQKGAKLHDYLIEDPVVDFEKYIRSLSLENEKQAKQLIEIGAKIIEEVFTSTITSTTEEEEVE